MLVWLDMANSPHPMLLGPLARELEAAGHRTWVTTRNHAQTLDLTHRFWPNAEVVGGTSPRSRVEKARALGDRVLGLRRLAARRRPDVAVSLNSYAQVIAARAGWIPSVTLMDYEFQPANHISFRLAQRVVVPAAFPDAMLRRYGVRSDARLCRFDGYKEELYLDQTEPSAQEDGWSAVPDVRQKVRCLFRPPPHGAMYHREGNDEFDDLLAGAGHQPETAVLVLPRFAEQRSAYAGLPGVTVAEQTVDGLAALLGADVFVGAGGTMCREAALLGIPAYTVFAGQMAAVDQRLIDQGRLRDLRGAGANLRDWTRRDDRALGRSADRLHARGESLRRWLVAIIEAASELRRHALITGGYRTEAWDSPR